VIERSIPRYHWLWYERRHQPVQRILPARAERVVSRALPLARHAHRSRLVCTAKT